MGISRNQNDTCLSEISVLAVTEILIFHNYQNNISKMPGDEDQILTYQHLSTILVY